MFLIVAMTIIMSCYSTYTHDNVVNVYISTNKENFYFVLVKLETQKILDNKIELCDTLNGEAEIKDYTKFKIRVFDCITGIDITKEIKMKAVRWNESRDVFCISFFYTPSIIDDRAFQRWIGEDNKFLDSLASEQFLRFESYDSLLRAMNHKNAPAIKIINVNQQDSAPR